MGITQDEADLIRDLGFETALVEAIREKIGLRLQRLTIMNSDQELQPGPGISLKVKDGEQAERLMNAIKPSLSPLGYRAFWSDRRLPDGRKETDEVVILKSADQYSMVRLRQTDGANYGISTDDIVNRLADWEKICEFDVVGASHDWVALQFSRLPEDIVEFAAEVNDLCHDAIDQGVGLLRERDNAELFRVAQGLPTAKSAVAQQREEEGLQQIRKLSPEYVEDFRKAYRRGIRLLAADMSMRKYLFLWWD